MKLLVFAHTPPPHHGQSYMVKLMLDGFGGDHRQHPTQDPAKNRFGLECYHVNARFSKDLEDIGSLRPLKFFILFWHCLQAIWCRYRYGIDAMYYIPAPGKRVALFRDWLVMMLCRPFFKRLILHWHAAGLSKWLETEVQSPPRVRTYRALGNADVSVVLSNWNRRDAEKLLPHKICVVHNGIPDPCPDFQDKVMPARRERFSQRAEAVSGTGTAPKNAPVEISVLFLAHCTREKGLFDAMEGVRIANATLRKQGRAARLRLTVAGNFIDEREKKEYEQLIALDDPATRPEYVGFASGETKHRLFAEADAFCFPTFFYAESFGLVVVEALAFGLPVVTTRWRSVPEVLPKDYPGLVAPHAPEQIAEALLGLATQDRFQNDRQYFLDHYLVDRHLDNLAQAIKQSESAAA